MSNHDQEGGKTGGNEQRAAVEYGQPADVDAPTRAHENTQSSQDQYQQVPAEIKQNYPQQRAHLENAVAGEVIRGVFGECLHAVFRIGSRWYVPLTGDGWKKALEFVRLYDVKDSLVDISHNNRYSRQTRLGEVGEAGQQRLLDSRVLMIGVGGLGSPVSMYLAAAGVGHLVISDYDRVDESNLQRQIAHSHADLGESKASSARRTLMSLNPGVRVDALDYELDGEELVSQTQQADVLVDCTDNFPTRFALNRVSLATGTPLVSGAAIRWQGQVATFVPGRQDSPCYQCLYPDESVEAATCAAEGILAPLVGIIGSLQALEVLTLLLDSGPGLCGQVLLFDGLAMECQTVVLPKNASCSACSDSHTTS